MGARTTLCTGSNLSANVSAGLPTFAGVFLAGGVSGNFGLLNRDDYGFVPLTQDHGVHHFCEIESFGFIRARHG